MSFVKCCVCHGRSNLLGEDKRQLDHSGNFVCSSECLIKWAEKHRKNQKRNILKHPSIFESSMGNAFDVWSDTIKMGFRSGYEKVVAEYFWDNDVAFQYEPYTFMLNKGDSSYTPDFYLPDYGVFIEVKGVFHNRKKLKVFRELYDYPLMVATWAIRKTFKYQRTNNGIFGA